MIDYCSRRGTGRTSARLAGSRSPASNKSSTDLAPLRPPTSTSPRPPPSPTFPARSIPRPRLRPGESASCADGAACCEGGISFVPSARSQVLRTYSSRIRPCTAAGLIVSSHPSQHRHKESSPVIITRSTRTTQLCPLASSPASTHIPIPFPALNQLLPLPLLEKKRLTDRTSPNRHLPSAPHLLPLDQQALASAQDSHPERQFQ